MTKRQMRRIGSVARDTLVLAVVGALVLFVWVATS